MGKNARAGRGPAYLAVCLALLVLLALSVLAAVSFGTMTIPIGDVYRVILHELFGLGDPAAWGSGGVHDVVWLIRLPRLILAIGVGTGLSVCGVVMQAIVKNPLADPYVLGVSSGAYLGATLAMLLGLGTLLGGSAMGVLGCAGGLPGVAGGGGTGQSGRPGQRSEAAAGRFRPERRVLRLLQPVYLHPQRRPRRLRRGAVVHGKPGRGRLAEQRSDPPRGAGGHPLFLDPVPQSEPDAAGGRVGGHPGHRSAPLAAGLPAGVRPAGGVSWCTRRG